MTGWQLPAEVEGSHSSIEGGGDDHLTVLIEGDPSHARRVLGERHETEPTQCVPNLHLYPDVTTFQQDSMLYFYIEWKT